jgi:hypothetical protein
MSLRLVIAAAGVCLLVGVPAQAQDAGRVGLVMGYPSVGVIWHVSDRVALRPEVDLSRVSSESESSGSLPTGGSGESWSAGTGVAALLYLGTTDALKPYVSPRFSYQKSSSTTSSAFGETTTTASRKTLSGSFGAEYSLGRRFAVFGEVGVEQAWIDTESESVLPVSRTTGRSTSLRSGVGAILYF